LDIALALERGHGRPALFDVLVRVGPVDLIEVDGIDLQPSQAGLAFPPDRLGLETVADLSALVPDHAALREDVRADGHAFESARDDLLRVAQPIDGRRVDPVDAGVQRLSYGRDGVTVVLTAPGELPA
jgi:hypothetical protein